MSDKQNWEIYQAILKDQAKPYLELNGPIEVYPLDEKIVDAQDGTILTQLWFGDLDGRSGFGGNFRGLSLGCRVHGVLKRSAEGASQKISGSLPYTQRQVEAELTRISRLEKEIVKSRQFLERLRH